MFEKITSFQNPRLKLIKKLRDKKARQQEARFVIDDTRDLQRALACGYLLDFALYCPALGDFLPALSGQHRQVYEVSREIMEKTSYRANPTPFVAVMHSPAPPDLRALPIAAPALGLVALEKPGNIGALLRTADATGFKTILLIDCALDLYNPNIIRSSTGACFLGNVYSLTAAQARTVFTEQRYTVIAAHLAGTTTLYDLRYDDRTAVLLGTEDTGLDDGWLDHCDHLMRIPMVGQVTDSLNVSVSGAVIMYEILRQRLYAASTR